jgi:hypothetical protein
LDHLLLAEGEALWVDSKNQATTTSLANISPSRRVLDRIHVARAFTAFQHYSIVEDLHDRVTNDTPLVIAPVVDWFYANDDLRTGEAETMLEGALDEFRRLADTHEIPILVSRRGAPDALGAAIAAAADRTLECVETQFGPRFTGDDFETLVFDCPGGVQTTFAFWRRVLEQRHPTQIAKTPEEVTHVGSY